MGELLRASCPACGHEVELLAGFGFAGVELEPRVCLDCRELVSVTVADRLRPDPPPELNRCPDCGGTNLRPFRHQLVAGGCARVVPSLRPLSELRRSRER